MNNSTAWAVAAALFTVAALSFAASAYLRAQEPEPALTTVCAPTHGVIVCFSGTEEQVTASLSDFASSMGGAR